MKKMTRSRILAVGISGAVLAGATLPLIPLALADTGTQAAAGALLARGQSLVGQHDYQTAKKVLLTINPADLSPTDRTSMDSLLQRIDVAISAAAHNSQVFRNAQASLNDGHLAHAVNLYNYIIASPASTPELIREAKDNLALTQARQQEMVPQLKTMLAKAIAAYKTGDYQTASNDLHAISVAGADLGSENSLPGHYQYLIAQKRVAAVNAQAAAISNPTPVATTATVAPPATITTPATPPPSPALNSQLAGQEAAAAQNRAAATQAAAAAEAAKEKAAQLVQAQAAAEAAKEAAARKIAAQQAALALAQQQKAAQAKLADQLQSQEMQAASERQAAAAAAQAAAQTAALKAQQDALAAQQKAEQAQLAAKVKAQQAAASQPAQPASTGAAVAIQTPPASANMTTTTPPAQTAPAPAPAATMPATMPMPATSKPVPVMPTAAEINAQRSAALTLQADQAVHAANYSRAIALFNDALVIDPRNQAASMGLANASKLAAGKAPGLLNQSLYNQAIDAQRAQVLFNHDLEQSSQEMQAGHFSVAADRANDALATAAAARHLFPASEYQAMRARASAQLAMIEHRQAVAASQSAAIKQHEIQTSQANIEQQLIAQRHAEVKGLMAQADEYYKRLEYNHAEATLLQVVAIDPTNYQARLMRRMVQDQIEYNRWNHYHDLRSRQAQEQEIKSEKDLIPYTNLIVYPSDWPELSKMREAEQNSSESSADKLVRNRLNDSVGRLSVNDQPFSEVVKLLRNETGTNIVVNWNALTNAGVSRQTPISLTLRSVPFKKVLSIVLQQAQGSSGTTLGYSIDEGVITISTKDQLAQLSVVRVYDITDLLIQPPNFGGNAPSFNLQSATQNSTAQVSASGGGGLGGGGGQSLFSGNGGAANGAGGANGGQKTRGQMVREITRLIENTVDRNSWVANGGTAGNVRELNGQLLISQTPDNQSKIESLLEKLREARAIEISVNTRFLIVNSSFLNFFGFSWSLGFPAFVTTNGAGAPTANSSSGSLFGGSTGPITFGNNTATIASPQATGVGNNIAKNFSAATSALNFSGSILSNYQFSLLLQATQESEHSTTLTAPRVTLYNGQESYITVTQQQNFVSSETGGQTVTGGVGAIATSSPTLNVSTLSTGVVLQVQATASADRRYVEMTIQPSLATLLGLTTFNITGQNITGGGAPAALGFVQLPDVQLTQVATTVSVPDGGTLLLGGQRLAGEVEVEAGVPILSKIPLINRLFTNRSYVRDTGILLILVRPRIIIQKEWERKQFGRNY